MYYIGNMKKKPLRSYVRPEIKDWVRSSAADRGISESEFVSLIIEERLMAEEEGKVLRHIEAESRVKELMGLAKDELLRIAESSEDLLGRIGCYEIANWEFLKRLAEELDVNITDTHRRNFLSTGSKRLRKALKKHLEEEGKEGVNLSKYGGD